jgi:hypothetical protein
MDSPMTDVTRILEAVEAGTARAKPVGLFDIPHKDG